VSVGIGVQHVLGGSETLMMIILASLVHIINNIT